MESPVDESNKLLDELWAKTMGVSDGSDWICQLRTHFGCKATWWRTTCGKDGQVIFQRLICFESYGEHQVRLEASSIGQEAII
jgi:hypothetical protein